MEADEVAAVMEMISSLQAQVTGLTTTVRVLIETHPDRAHVESVLKRQKLRLEAVLGASTTPEPVLTTTLSLLDDMLTIARREPEIRRFGEE